MENKTNNQVQETKKVKQDVVVAEEKKVDKVAESKEDLANSMYNLSKKVDVISLVKYSQVKKTDIATFDKIKVRLETVKRSGVNVVNRLVLLFGKFEVMYSGLSSSEKILIEEKYNLTYSNRVCKDVGIRIFKGSRQDGTTWMRYELFIHPALKISDMLKNTDVVLIEKWTKADINLPFNQKKFDFRIINSDEILPNEDDVNVVDDWDD